MTNSEKWLGPEENAYDYFTAINEAGMDELVAIRNENNERKGDGKHRAERTWGSTEASILVGRTPEWLRQNDPDVPKNGAGKGRWSLKRILELMDKAGTRYVRPMNSRALALAMSKFKGGVGNTTNTIHIAHGLATKGLRVLIWDQDGQATLTQAAGGVVPDLELEDEDLPLYAMEKDPKAILDPDRPIVQGTYFHNVDLVPANSALNELEMKLVTQYLKIGEAPETDISPEYRMKAILEYIKDFYDVILIDCPPTLGINTMNGLLAADGIITSVKPELFDRASLVAYTDALAALCDNHNKDFSYFRILISQFQDGIRTDRSGTVRGSGHQAGEQALRRIYGDAVMYNMMHHSKEISKASSELSSVIANDKAVGSKKARDRAVNDVVYPVVNEIFEDLKMIWEAEREDD